MDAFKPTNGAFKDGYDWRFKPGIELFNEAIDDFY